MVRHHSRMREFAESYVATRERTGLPPVDVDDVMWARAVEIVLDGGRRVDRLTSRDVAAAVWKAKGALRGIERGARDGRFERDLFAYIERHAQRLRAEAAMENRARVVRGKAPLELATLMKRIGALEMGASVNHGRQFTSCPLGPRMTWD